MAVPKKINPQTGQTYRVQPTTGGVFHVYPDGRKVFVGAGAQPGQFTDKDMQAWQGQAQRMGAAGGIAPSGYTNADQAAWNRIGANIGAGRGLLDNGGAAAAQSGSGDGLDSDYAKQQAQALAAMNAQLSANDQQGVSNETARAEALRRLNVDQPADYHGAKVSANKQGLFYSSELGSKLGDIATAYTRRRGDVQANFQGQEDARLAARGAIQAGYTVDEAANLAAAKDRQIGRDTSAADAGALVPNAPAAPAVAPQAKKPAFRTVTAHGLVYHVHPNGRRVPIRKVSRP